MLFYGYLKLVQATKNRKKLKQGWEELNLGPLPHAVGRALASCVFLAPIMQATCAKKTYKNARKIINIVEFLATTMHIMKANKVNCNKDVFSSLNDCLSYNVRTVKSVVCTSVHQIEIHEIHYLERQIDSDIPRFEK